MIEIVEIKETINITIEDNTNNINVIVDEVQEVINIQISEVGVQGPPGTRGDINTFVYNEIPNGIINGINVTFISANDFIPESVQLYINGIFQKQIDDYITIGNNRIDLNYSPKYSENIIINYLKL